MEAGVCVGPFLVYNNRMKKLIYLSALFLFVSVVPVHAELTAVIRGAVIRGAVIAPAVAVDPCAGKSIGQACTGGAIYAGTFDPQDGGGVKKYMTTPADAGLKQWAPEYAVTTATSTTDGVANTTKIEAKGTTYVAGYYCGTLTAHGYSDWFLPANDELNLLYVNKAAIGGFDVSGNYPASCYWSSTEGSNIIAWYQLFNSGVQYNNFAKGNTISVRCVRRY